MGQKPRFLEQVFPHKTCFLIARPDMNTAGVNILQKSFTILSLFHQNPTRTKPGSDERKVG